MKLRLLVPSLALAFSSLAVHAQVGLYLNPVVSRVSATPDTGTFAFLGSGNSSQIFGGVDFGGYYTLAHFAKADVSADIRDAIQHGNAASLNSLLLGVAIAAKPLNHGLKPYVQLSVGEGRTKSPLSSIHESKLEYDIFGGVDKPLNKVVDWRIIEIGYGSTGTIGSVNFGGSGPLATATLLNFSTGFVFRIH